MSLVVSLNDILVNINTNEHTHFVDAVQEWAKCKVTRSPKESYD